MATIIFYEKPHCGNNTRQKQMLETAGHTVIAKNLLTEAWTTERLMPFLQNYPVPEWFNPAAPRVKSGEIVPTAVNAETALTLLLNEPLLIRRPLMQVEAEYRIGFDPESVQQWLGLNPVPKDHIETCPRQHQHASCHTP